MCRALELNFSHHGIQKYDKHINIYTKNKRLLLMPYEQTSNLKTSKFSTASKSEHLRNGKKRTNRFPLSPIFEIQTNYKSISPNISVGKNTSNISKQSEKYIQTTYAKEFFLGIFKFCHHLEVIQMHIF